MKTTMDLDGIYKLKRLDCGTDIGFVFRDDFYPAGYLDARVPGDVRTALRSYGLIDGYYLGKDLDKERWIEESDWLYVRDFFCGPSLEGKENVLCFDGIDTLAEVWLNGALLGKTDNMFLQQRFDVGDILRYGGYNTLAVKILSPVESTKGADRTGIYPEDDTTRMLLRKSQMNWGWDFCGHCLTGGIWKSVRIESRDCAVFETVHLRTVRLEEGRAVLAASLKARPWKAGGSEGEGDPGKGDGPDAVLLLSFAGRAAARAELSADGTETEFEVENPRLWWPRPYGDANLYDVTALLYDGGKEADRRQFRFGIRTAVLNQEKDEAGGRRFRFEVNGRQLFVRGANWVPANCVYAEIEEEDYDFYIRRAVESNLSMLRVWGGGIYESDRFFDLCDENGIMVFQDFMLACGIFPQDDAFLDRVSEEAAAVADRYYNRASLVLWSADNELDQAYWWYEQQDHFRENRVNRIGVARAVKEIDPHRPFLVSSPCSPFEGEAGDDDPNSPLQGDMHIYLTRFLPSSEYYYKKLLEFVPRFMSEYGFSSLPVEDSYHIFNFFGEKLDLTRNPWLAELPWLDEMSKTCTAQEIIYFTQFTHAHALKYWIEYLRSWKGVCGGSLYWKFNDPVAPNRENMLFPTLMSSIDFMRRPKLAYYYAKRAYEDVILAFRETKEGLELYGCSERLQDDRGTLRLAALSWDGTVLWETQEEAVIAADRATRLFLLKKEELERFGPRDSYVKAVMETASRRLENRFFLTEIGEFNEVRLPQARLEVRTFRHSRGLWEVEISADSFAQDVMLSVQDTDVFYSDNGFCLDAGQKISVSVRQEKEGLDGKRLRIGAYNSAPATVIL